MSKVLHTAAHTHRKREGEGERNTLVNCSFQWIKSNEWMYGKLHCDFTDCVHYLLTLG